jgi:type I restriction enzyme S subunit
VSEEYHRENIGYAAHEGTIVVCLDGEIRSQFFLSYELPAHVNQRVAILKAKTIRPELLTAWLNHPCLQEQLLQWSVQTTVEHISNSIIAGALVPRLKDEEENKLADDVLWSRTAGWISNRLILAAKLLVESLIERRVTEDELVAAHNDSSADRDLMQRLRVDGFDESGSSPLFEDLDRLQELLYEASSSGGSDEV